KIAGILSAAHRRKTYKHVGLVTHRLEKVGDGVIAQAFGNGKVTVSTGATRMNHTLWNTLAVKVCELFKQVMVIKRERATSANANAVIVISYRRTSRCCKCRFAHIIALYVLLRSG